MEKSKAAMMEEATWVNLDCIEVRTAAIVCDVVLFHFHSYKGRTAEEGDFWAAMILGSGQRI